MAPILTEISNHLAQLPSFEIDADAIIIDRLHWDRHIEVDVHDNKINNDKSADPFGYSQANNFHKHKQITNFKSSGYIKFSYKSIAYEFHKTIFVEHTTVRMKL